MFGDSILGLAKELNIFEKKVTPKVLNKSDPPQETKKVAIIQPDFFREQSIIIKISDRMLANVVELAMKNIGATVLREHSIFADFVISDKPISVVPSIPSRSRGLALLKSAQVEIKTPKVIEVKQIPWIYNFSLQLGIRPVVSIPKKSKSTSNIMGTNKRIPNLLVVADSSSRYRPIMQVIEKFPQLHFGDVPRGYTISPFEMLPHDFKPVLEKLKLHLRPKKEESFQKGPANKSYCDLCNCWFNNAEEHHNSADHKYNANSDEWIDFDELSEFITKKRFDSAPGAPLK